MNKLLTPLVAGLLFATPTLADKKSYDYTQHNFKVKTGDIALTYRDHDTLDKSMGQIDYKIEGFTTSYRYQDSKGEVEHRVRLTSPTLLKVGNLKVSSRLEYRMFDKESKDDFGNVWIRAKYNQSLFGNVSGYIAIQPKLAFASDEFNDGEFYSAQNQVGVDYKVNSNLTVGAFYEQNTDEDWHVTEEFIGTNVTVKF